ncbi:MAG: hypothetical protein JKY65_25635, partial [Planctomycetes bacterium]|nr:hypothetical protein [Planctomycetota bacterium]
SGTGSLGGAGNVDASNASLDFTNFSTALTTPSLFSFDGASQGLIVDGDDAFFSVDANASGTGVIVTGNTLVVNGDLTATQALSSGLLNIDVAGALSLVATNGSLTTTTGILTVGGDVTANTLSTLTGGITLDGAGAQDVTQNGVAFGAVTIANTASGVGDVAWLGAISASSLLVTNGDVTFHVSGGAITGTFQVNAGGDALTGAGGTLLLGGDLTLAGASFTPGGTTLEFNAGVDQTITSSLTLGAIRVNQGGGASLLTSGGVTVGALTLDAGDLAPGNAAFLATGTVDLNGGTYTTTSGSTITHSVQTNFDGTTVTVGVGSDVRINGNVTSSAPGVGNAINMSAGLLSFGGATVGLTNVNVNQTLGTITSNAGGTQALSLGPNSFFNYTVDGNVNQSIGVLTVTSVLQVNQTLDLNSGAGVFTDITVSGTGNLDATDANFTASGTVDINGALTSGAGRVLGFTGVGAGDFVSTGGVGTGTLDLGSCTLEIAAAVVDLSTFNTVTTSPLLGGQTIVLNGAAGVQLTQKNATTFRNLTINKTAAGTAVTPQSALRVTGAFLIQSGTYDADQDTIVDGLLTLNGNGRFSALVGGATFSFNAATNCVQIDTGGIMTLDVGTVPSAGGLDVFFQSNCTVSGPGGQLNVVGLTGSVTNYVLLAPVGAAWTLTANGVVSVLRAEVRNSTGAGANIPISAATSVDGGGNNTPGGWIFPAKDTTWTRTGAIAGIWSDPANWGDGVPVATDRVFFNDTGNAPSQMDIGAGAGGLSLESIDMSGGAGYSGTLSILATAPLTTTGDATLRGVVNMSANLTLGGTAIDLGGAVNTGAFILQASNAAGTTTLSGGTKAVSGGGTLDIDGDLLFAGGTLSTTGGTTTVAGTLTGASGTLNGSGTITVAGDTVTLSGGIATGLALGSTFQLTGASPVSLSINTLDTFGIFQNSATGGLTINGTGVLTVGAGLTSSNTLLFANAAGANIGGALTVDGGNFTGDGGQIQVGGGLTLTTAGTVDLVAPGPATELLLDGTGPQAINQGSHQLGVVRVNKTAGTTATWITSPANISGNLVVENGSVAFTAFANNQVLGDVDFSTAAAENLTLLAGVNTLAVGGNWDLSNADAFTPNASTVLFTGTNPQSITSGGFAFNNLSVTKASGTVSTLANAVVVNGNLLVSSGGNMTLGTTTTVTGNLTLSTSGTFDTGSQNLSVTTGTTAFNGAAVTIAGGTVDLDGPVSTSGGSVVTHGSGTVQVSNALVVLGTVDWRGAGGGIFTLDGATQALTTPAAGASTGFGVFNANMSTLATVTGTLTTQSTNVTVSTAELRMGGSTLTVATDLTLTNGGVLTGAGVVSVTNDLIVTSGSVTMATGAGALTVSNDLTLTSGGVTTAGGALSIGRDLALAGGLLSVGTGGADVVRNLVGGAGGLTLAGTFSIAGPIVNTGTITLAPGGSLFQLRGAAQVMTLNGNFDTFAGFEVTNTASGNHRITGVPMSVTTLAINKLGPATQTDIDVNLIVTGTTGIAATARLDLNQPGASVRFGAQVSINGTLNINPLSGGLDVELAPGIGNGFMLGGAAAVLNVQGATGVANYVSLHDNLANGVDQATRWELDNLTTPSLAVTFNQARITDSHTRANQIANTSQHVGGSNLNPPPFVTPPGWDFAGKTTIWIGGAGTSWANDSNWTAGAPVARDTVVFDDSSTGNSSLVDVTIAAPGLAQLDMAGGNGGNGNPYVDTLTIGSGSPLLVQNATSLRGTVVVNANLTLGGATNSLGATTTIAAGGVLQASAGG